MYSVSKLHASSDKKNVQPNVELRPIPSRHIGGGGGGGDERQQQASIFLPQVSLDDNDDISIGSSNSTLTYQSQSVSLASNKQRDKKAGNKSSLGSPIRNVNKGRGMIVEVTAQAGGGSVVGDMASRASSSFDKLDLYLPRELRGNRKRVAAEAMRSLRNSLNAVSAQYHGAAGMFEMMDGDGNNSVRSYEAGDPVHFSSGSSVKLSPSKTSIRNTRKNQLMIAGSGGGEGSLWGEETPELQMEALEVQLREKKRQAALSMEYKRLRDEKAAARALRIANGEAIDEIDAKKGMNEGEEEEQMTLDGEAVHGALFVGEDGNISIDHSHSSRQHRHRIDAPMSLSDTTADSRGGPLEESTSAIILMGDDEEPSLLALAKHATTAAATLKPSASPRSAGSAEELSDTFPFPASSSSVATVTSAQAQATSRILFPRHRNLEFEQAAMSISKSLESKTREALKQLGKYVKGHTNRKVMLAWAAIEGRFHKSTVKKTVMIRASNGLLNPAKQSALPLSALTSVLSSPVVKLSYDELVTLYEKMGVSDAEALNSRRLAAIKIVLGPDNGKYLKQGPVLLEELQMLQKAVDPIISIEQVKEAAFPQDPEQRELEMANLEAERELYVSKTIEERRKRDELKEQVEIRQRKLLEDYDRTLSEIQFPKGPVSNNKLIAFKELIAYCKKTYDTNSQKKDVQIAPELVALLGIDAFPTIIQEIIVEQNAVAAREALEKEEDMRKKKEALGGGKAALLAILKEKEQENALEKEKAERELASPASPKSSKPKAFKPKAQATSKAASASVVVKPPRLVLENHCHFKLTGQPSVLSLIRTTVSYGKGLNGMAYRDVVETLQAFAATRIQTMFRRNKRKWRYFAARVLWRKKFHGIEFKYLNAWRKYTRHAFDTRDFAWRKLKAWQFFTKRAILRREKFRIAFWPFHVWHRWAAAERTAQEKTQFLVHRVLPTYILLIHFRGWKKYYKHEQNSRDMADAFVLKMLKKRGKVCLLWYVRWTRRRKQLRKVWYKEGIVNYKHKIYLRKSTPFFIWKSYWFYKKLVAARVKSFTSDFRTHFLTGKKFKLQLTLGEKKKKKKKEAEESSKAGKKGKKRGGGGKRSQKKGGGADSEDSESVDESESSSAPKSRFGMSIKKFEWKLPRPNFDIDSDGEEEEFVPLGMQTAYREKIEELAMPISLEFLENVDDYTMDKVTVMARRFTFVDNWALLESSMRYNKYLQRAFANLRAYAKLHKNSRKSGYKITQNSKKKAFMGLLAWMLRDPNSGMINFDGQTDADQICVDVKSYRMEKIMRWRNAAIAIKTVFGRHEDTQDDNGDGDGKRGGYKRAAAAAAAKAAANVPKMIDGVPYETPNFLEWDREDRRIEMEQAERMTQISKDVNRKTILIAEDAENESQRLLIEAKHMLQTVTEVFDTENAITSAAIDAETQYVSRFKIHAADNLLIVLVRIYREVQLYLMKEETKKYFRGLRMPFLKKRSRMMFNRKKMINWIRICRRLNGLYEKAPVYHVRRKMWCIFNRWLKLVEKESLNATPGLVPIIQRINLLYPGFSNTLKSLGFVKMVYSNNKRLYEASATLKVIFQRWVMTVHENKMFALMEKKAAAMYNIKLLHKVFYSMKTAMSSEGTVSLRAEAAPFILTRICCDLDHISKRFIAFRRKNLALAIASYNRRFTYYQKRDAKRAPSFKTFLEAYRGDVNNRLKREQRILAESFEARGTIDFVDVCCPDQKDPIMPSIMSRLEGKHFADPRPYNPDLYDDEDEDEMSLDSRNNIKELQPTLPGGFKVYKVRINHQAENGMNPAAVVGWQLVWSGDCAKDVEGPKRGKWKGAAMTVHELVIPNDEFIVGVEYLYEGGSMLGVRLKLFYSGFSRWLGGKPSMATLSVYLGAEEVAPRQSFEDDYVSPGKDEDENLAMPRTYVVGFTGIEVSGKCTAMGLVVRKVREQHIFSYFWVQDALDHSQAVVHNGEGTANHDQHANSAHARVQFGEHQQQQHGGNLHNSGAALHHDPSHHAGNHQSLPSIGGAGTHNNAPELDFDERSHGSDGGGSAAPSLLSMSSAGEESTTAGGGSISSSTTNKPDNLSSSEEQFFDVMRMRVIEIQTAERRAEAFARRMWTARQLRINPELSKLTNIRILSGLAKWYFAAICKRMVRATKTEAQGTKMMETAHRNRSQIDSLLRRANSEFGKAKIFEQTPQSWSNKTLLAPHERAEKKIFAEHVKFMVDEAKATKALAKKLQDEATRLEKIGKMLLPRMAMSEYVTTNYRVKILAARHKETLLERMDMDAIKRAMSGGDAKVSELDEVSMEMIRSSLAGRKLHSASTNALDLVIEQELQKLKKLNLSKENNNTHVLVPQTPGGGGSDERDGRGGNTITTATITNGGGGASYMQSKFASSTSKSFRKMVAINGTPSVLSSSSSTLFLEKISMGGKATGGSKPGKKKLSRSASSSNL